MRHTVTHRQSRSVPEPRRVAQGAIPSVSSGDGRSVAAMTLTSTVPSSRWSLWIFCGTHLHCSLVQVEFVDLLRDLPPLSPRPGGVCGSSAGLTSTVPSSRWSLWIFCGTHIHCSLIQVEFVDFLWDLPPLSPRPGGVCGFSTALTSTVPSSRWSLWIFCGTHIHCSLVQVEFVDFLWDLPPLSPRPGGVCGFSAADRS